MPLDWIIIFVLPVLLIAGTIFQIVKARRQGLRGREAFRAIFRPTQILMQSAVTATGLQAPHIEVAGPNSANPNSTTRSN